MKATGIIRYIDALGRVVIPKQYLRSLNLENGDPIEFILIDQKITIGKHRNHCVVCGSFDDLREVHPEKRLCTKCIKLILTVL